MLDDSPIFSTRAKVEARLSALPAAPFLAYFKRGGLAVVLDTWIAEDEGEVWINADTVSFGLRRERAVREWSPYPHNCHTVGPNDVDSNLRAAFRDIVADYNAGRPLTP